jgi:hypothetical protein
MAVSELNSFLYHFGYDLEIAWRHHSLSFESNKRIIWTDFDKILDPADLSPKISNWAATFVYFTPSCLTALYVPCFVSKVTRFSFLLDETTDSATEIAMTVSRHCVPCRGLPLYRFSRRIGIQ